MRIAYLGVIPLPGGVATVGIAKASETLLREYESFNPSFHVDVLTLAPGFKEELLVKKGNVDYHFVSCPTRGRLLRSPFEIQVLRRLIRSLDVDLVHGQPWAEYMLATVGCGIPHVITVHGLFREETSQLHLWQGERLRGLVREKVQRRALRKSRNIISISPYIEEYIRGWTRARVWPIPNLIDREFFHIQPARQQPLKILCVGSVSSRKNQKLLIQACEELTLRKVEYQCRIVGRISEESVAAEIRLLVQRKMLGQYVEITGAVSKDRLLAYYQWANVTVLPSHAETSPLSLIQAMACGHCVFGAAAAGIPALLRYGTFGTLFSPHNAGDLFAKLLAFEREPEPYWDKAAKAREYAHATFHPSAVARETVRVYGEIVSKELNSYSSG